MRIISRGIGSGSGNHRLWSRVDAPNASRIVITGKSMHYSGTGMSHDRNAINQRYFETHFRVDGPQTLWPEKFVIISACATTGESWTEQETAVANRNLANVLHARSAWLTRILGFSPTTGHAEPSWAVDLPVDEACDIGLRFRQDAIYRVEHDDLFVLLCRAPSVRGRVGSFRQRIETGGGASKA